MKRFSTLDLKRTQAHQILRARSARPTTASVIYRTKGWKLRFNWDAVGLLANGDLILVEAELGPIYDSHVQLHLTRLAIMLGRGANIDRFVWVARKGTISKLKNIVEGWLIFLSPAVAFRFPRMEFISVERLR